MKENSFKIFLRVFVTVLSSIYMHETVAQDKLILKNANVYLVRHTEKDTGTNPILNAIGRQRSGHLVRALKGTAIQKIFVTQYLRTQQTADSLMLKTKADTIHYIADATGNGIISMLKKHVRKNGKILIIGHSNTIPVILGRLGVKNTVNIRDDEYNTLYLIKFVKGEPILFSKKYGDPVKQHENTGWKAVL